MQRNVESILEESIPLLKKAKQSRLLNEKEIRIIIKRRRDLEYSINRPSTTRKNYLEYILLEQEINELLQKRLKTQKEKAQRHSEDKAKQNKLKLRHDRSNNIIKKIQGRIHFIYSRGLNKLPNDVDLWIHYANYCIEQKKIKTTSKILMRALSLCGGNHVSIWLFTISFHFDYCTDSKTSRAIAQKALKMFPSDFQLWLQYFQLECFYLSRLITRRYAIGLSTQNENEEEEENELASFWTGGVPFTVFKTAIQKLKLTELQYSQFYNTATKCPLIPSDLISSMFNLMKENISDSSIFKFIQERFEWDCEKLNLDKRIALSKGENDSTTINSDQLISNTLDKSMNVMTDILGKVRNPEDDHLNISELSNQEALDASIDNMEELVLKLCKTYSKDNKVDKDIFETLKYAIQLRRKQIGSNNDQGNDIKTWNIQTLKQYLQKGYDDFQITEEDLFKCMFKLCCVPFRNEDQDKTLCLYLEARGIHNDESYLDQVSTYLLSQPPITMRSLTTFINVILRLLENDQGKTRWHQPIQSMFNKGANLSEAKSDVTFWCMFVDFERGTMKNARQASRIHSNAVRSLQSEYQTDFVERLSLMNLR